MERDISKLERVLPPFPRVTYEEAIAILQKKGNLTKLGDDFGGDEETILSQEFDRPVIVHRYPKALKAFYMQPDEARPDLALCMDVLAPEGYGEVIGGGERAKARVARRRTDIGAEDGSARGHSEWR